MKQAILVLATVLTLVTVTVISYYSHSYATGPPSYDPPLSIACLRKPPAEPFTICKPYLECNCGDACYGESGWCTECADPQDIYWRWCICYDGEEVCGTPKFGQCDICVPTPAKVIQQH